VIDDVEDLFGRHVGHNVETFYRATPGMKNTMAISAGAVSDAVAVLFGKDGEGKRNHVATHGGEIRNSATLECGDHTRVLFGHVVHRVQFGLCDRGLDLRNLVPEFKLLICYIDSSFDGLSLRLQNDVGFARDRLIWLPVKDHLLDWFV
jgi:hypothetical protein